MKGKSPSSSFQKIPLFQGLSNEELKSIQACLKEKSFDKGELLFMEGNMCERIFLVRSGRVKLYRTNSQGREQILEILEAGDTCACNPGTTTWHCSSTAEAVTSCTVWFLSRDDYIRMVQANSKLAHTLNHVFAQRLNRFSCLIEEVSLKDVKKRVIKFLLDMYHHETGSGSGNSTLSIPFTREEIAQRIGTARETIARNLYELKRANLIDIKPKQVILKDIAGLEKLLQ
ncbi:MAG: hypothetical protein COV74_10740 [Candidatus Omnitrophica bacterium CG11_big_fil_rev_8_21_14_0_20_45_26]|uniref:Crp/Fnr family transcriptional regulator n=1 Tax=Candidatus Abzuiibacterium crystallinum TaxID=1974748 RepID=A0A2H0LNJ5_9BACT|nr:MAG: hypothetical protein COV74_10740 [Candidatus Omnitrophica bacterium CG11_big_fil_rev_8_21_14_0_20_45_26]PIW63858.1 MAG: hypothetical protein COW12_08070 [Candidatus Omnitrophica bacterium CG12_big_fil_rev_8_21_14_0_65_45_16]